MGLLLYKVKHHSVLQPCFKTRNNKEQQQEAKISVERPILSH